MRQLVALQRDQRRDDNGRPAEQQAGELVDRRLAAAGRQHREDGASAVGRGDRTELPRPQPPEPQARPGQLANRIFAHELKTSLRDQRERSTEDGTFRRRSGGFQVATGSIQPVNRRLLSLAAVVSAVLVTAGCGGGKHASSSGTPTASQPTTRQSPTSTSPGALQAEAASVATGDIPDNQVYLVYRSRAGWSMKYPEGWAQSGKASATGFRDKNNIVRVVVGRGSPPTPAGVRRDPSLSLARITSAPARVTTGRARAIKVVYSTQS